MVKKSTKYYCDLCGKESPWCMKYKIPDINSKIIRDAYNPDIRSEKTWIEPTKVDLCQHCSELIFMAIMDIKNNIIRKQGEYDVTEIFNYVDESYGGWEVK